MKKIWILLCISLPLLAQKPSKKDYVITMETSKGTLNLLLFDDTPKHKENFLSLVKDGFYDGTLFHRVINEFMIQGGDPESKTAKPGQRLGSGGDDIPRVPYEFTPKHVHIKGALAAARTNNPKRESSGCQFYIVTGKKYTSEQLNTMKQRAAQTNTDWEGMEYTEDQVKAYAELGGTPFLDNNYTVFGTVIQGIEVADAIQQAKTVADRPTEDISMKIKAKKMSKKKISKKYNYIFPS